MRGEGLRDRSQPRTWPRKRTLSGCLMNGNLDNIVYIDVEGDRYDDVIIIDVPESLQQKFRGSSVPRKGKKIHFGGIISIDDDESNNVEYPEISEVGGDLYRDTSSSKRFPASDRVDKSVNLGDDECQVVQEKDSTYGLSKRMQSYCRKYCRNRYGLNPESGSCSSGSDCFDCEVMEGSFAKSHKEWEKASLKRKANVRKGKSGLEDHAGPSYLDNETELNNVEVEKRTEQLSETFFSCNSRNANYENNNCSAFIPTDDGDLGTASLNPGMRSSFVYSRQEGFSLFKSGLRGKVHFSQKNGGSQFRETYTDPSSSCFRWQGYNHVNDCGRNFHDGEKSSQGPSCLLNQEKNHRRTSFADKTQNFMGEQLNFQEVDGLFHHRKTVFEDEEASLLKSQQSGETHVDNERVIPSDKYDVFSLKTSCNASVGKSHHTRTVFMEKEKLFSRELVVSNSGPFCETGGESVAAPSEHNVGHVFEKSLSCKVPSAGLPDVSSKEAGQQYTEEQRSGADSLSNMLSGETLSQQELPCLEEVKGQVIGSTADCPLHNRRDPFHSQSVCVAPAVQNDVINKREKLKETDEYKRAMEVEWASRERQLKTQAEEAKRLRKKKRAESMRLLDMERRQKQRLEEIRETQKKDEENINLKEQVRAEVRMELYKLESKCIDMASLLRALGINVGGSYAPLSHEVRAAYKRALLRFHPDRTSKTGIRQQVEAEEKFKLIFRMKENFLLTSC